MTAAQKTAKAKFKQAIAYRQKTGVSLKEAFAHVYGKKVGAASKKKAAKKAAPKKAAKKVVKKAAPKKVGSVHLLKPNIENIKALENKILQQKQFLKTDKNNLRLKNIIKLNESSLKTLKEFYKLKSKKLGVAPKKRKPIKEQSILNKIHKVKDQVNQLDELQHKHMSKIGALSSHVIHEVKEAHDKLVRWQKVLLGLQKEKLVVPKSMHPAVNMDIKRVKDTIKEQKTHIAQLKKHIK
jgi:hypothetical protein